MLKYHAVKNDALLAAIYKAELKQDHMTLSLLTPAAKAYRNVLQKKDLYYSMAEGTAPDRTISQSVKNKSWGELKQMAAQVGEKESRSNQFKLVNNAFKKIKPKLKKLKNSKKHMSYVKSVEFNDFQMMMDVLKESGAEPLFISVPVHGKWYDYTGFPKKGGPITMLRSKNRLKQKVFR